MTTWNESQYQALSQKVADKLRPADYILHNKAVGSSGEYWLYEDWHTLMELCVKHGIGCEHFGVGNPFGYVTANFLENQIISYQDHNNDPSLTERIARLLALLEATL